MLTKRNVADIVVMFKGLPRRKEGFTTNHGLFSAEDAKELGDKVVEHLKMGAHVNDVFGVIPRDFGCEIAGTQGRRF